MGSNEQRVAVLVSWKNDLQILFYKLLSRAIDKRVDQVGGDPVLGCNAAGGVERPAPV